MTWKIFIAGAGEVGRILADDKHEVTVVDVEHLRTQIRKKDALINEQQILIRELMK